MAPLIWGLFKWIGLYQKGRFILETVVGVGASIGFIMFYNTLLASPMSAVFATTAFGQSESIGQFVFGILIPIIETIFFFVILPSWFLWKIGGSISNFDRVNFKKGFMVILLSAVFTIFHATAKGLTNHSDLIATFIFAVVSIALIIYFKTAWAAVLMHVLVNSYSIGLLQSLKELLLSNMLYVAIGVGVVLFLLRKKGVKIPFIS